MPATLTPDPLVMEVRAALARRQQTHEALAQRLSLSRNAVTRRLSGQVPFTHTELREISSFLDIKIADLFHQH